MKSRSHRLPTISDTPDDWVDESWTVDCVCGVNFDDGEEMVDCDECGVWVHTRCSRYVKSEKLFSCDKCKSKKLRKESEETEVAQLLVELPTKTLRMDNPYPINCPQSSFQVWTEIPLEEKVHVQGIPGGDPSLFNGVSSVFSQQLWKCTGYVPKKFNSQYREFPCWDERQDDDNKEKEESEKNHDSKGADALFSLSTSGGNKSQVNEGGVMDMGPPSSDVKKQDVRKEKSIVIHSGNQKKDESKMVKDQSKKKNVKDKEGDSKKQDLQSFESDAKQSESNEGKGHKVSKIDKQNLKPENSRMDVKENHKSDDNNTPLSSGQPLENLPIDELRLSPSKEATQMEENDGNKLSTTSVEISVQKEDEMASSIKQNPNETSTNKDEVVNNVVNEVNENGGNCSTSNGSQPNLTNLEKPDVTPNVNLPTIPSPPIEVKPQEANHPEKTSNSQNTPTSDPKLDTSQDTKTSNNRLSPITEDKKESLSASQSEIPSKSQSQRKITGKPSSKSRHSTTEDRSSSGKQKVVTSENNNSKIKKDNSSKSLSTSAIKTTHLTKSTSHMSKKNSSDSKDSGDSASSLRCETGEKEQNNKSTLESSQKGEKIIKHVTKNLSDEELALLLHQELNSSPRVPRVPRMRHAGSLPQLASSTPGTSTLMKRTSSSGGKDNGGPRKRQKEFDKKGDRVAAVVPRRESGKNGSANKSAPPVSSGPSSSNEGNEQSNNMLSPINGSDDEVPTHRTLPGLIAEIMSKGKRMAYEELCNAVLPHWPNLRKHNGERYAYSSHSQAVLDCLRNRSEWARLVDRGPKTNAGRKRRKSEVDAPNVESEEDEDYNTDKNTKDDNNKNSGDEYPKGKRKARKHRRLTMQGTRVKDVVRRRRRKAEVVSDENEEDDDESDEDSEESAFSEEGGRTSVANEASASSDETGTMS